MFTSWITIQITNLSTNLNEHTSILLFLLLVTSPFFLTYALTTYRFHRAISLAKTNALLGNSIPSETPTLPYWFPFLGHTLHFVFSTSSFISHLASRYPSLPVKLYVGGRPLQFIPHGDPVSTLHRHPRKVTNVLIPMKFMADTGLSREDQLRGEIDELSGVLPRPNPGWEHLPESRRWNYLEHGDFASHLSGTSHEAVLGQKFAERLTRELLSFVERSRATKDKEGWITLPDLTKFLRETIFIAATCALYGPELLNMTPDLPKTYWKWLDQMPQMFRRLPRWLIPGAYAAREKTLQAFKKWDEIKRRKRPEVLERARRGIWEWDPLHGSTLTQARTKMFDEFGISTEGTALFHSAMMFALTPNATYATIWSFIDVLRGGPDLISRVMTESAPCFPSPHSLTPNTTELSRLPLLGSIFMETLRLRAASPVGRTPIDDTFHLYTPCQISSNPRRWDTVNGPQMKWKLEKDIHIISSSWLGGHDATFWNEGYYYSSETGKPEHPVDEFWAERFLEYPGDPLSGPVKKPHGEQPFPNTRKIFTGVATGKGRQLEGSEFGRTKTAEEADKSARLVTQGTSSHWFPFGGGLNTCPGRHFAKKEVMVAVAILLRIFEFDGLELEAGRLEVNMDHYPFGTLPPKERVSVRLRLRDCYKDLDLDLDSRGSDMDLDLDLGLNATEQQKARG